MLVKPLPLPALVMMVGLRANLVGIGVSLVLRIPLSLMAAHQNAPFAKVRIARMVVKGGAIMLAVTGSRVLAVVRVGKGTNYAGTVIVLLELASITDTIHVRV
jgi:hypothetical protein